MIQHLASLPILLPMLTAVILLLPPCGKSVKIIWEMILQYMGKGKQIYGKCVI